MKLRNPKAKAQLAPPHPIIAGAIERIEAQNSEILRLLHSLLHQSQIIIQKENEMAATLDDLTAQVAASTTVEQSAIVLIQGLAAQIAAAGADPVKLAALTANLKASADSLAAAVAANTPAAS